MIYKILKNDEEWTLFIQFMCAISAHVNELTKLRQYKNQFTEELFPEFTVLHAIEKLLSSGAMAPNQLHEVAIRLLDEKNFFDEHGLDKPQSSSAQLAAPIQVVEEPESANERMGDICN